jgi:EAL domain-containing protein (putative c-di-GMP-specific phosphodiesterase class I)
VVRRWESEPATRHLTISVNVSEREIMRDSFTADVRAIVEAAGVDPTLVKFEVTESLLIEDVEHVARVMEDLRSLGVGFALDDFGTGYSSLRLLKGLPFDQLKIDRGFVDDLVGIDADSTIVRTIITMGQFLGLDVVAEGVESAEQRAVLTMLGCEAFQGYYFAVPLPPEEFDEYVHAHRSRA